MADDLGRSDQAVAASYFDGREIRSAQAAPRVLANPDFSTDPYNTTMGWYKSGSRASAMARRLPSGAIAFTSLAC